MFNKYKLIGTIIIVAFVLNNALCQNSFKWVGISGGIQYVNTFTNNPSFNNISPYLITMWSYKRFTCQLQIIQPVRQPTLYRIGIDYLIIKSKK